VPLLLPLPAPSPPFPIHSVPVRCSKTITPLKPTDPPATITLSSAPLPPRPYKRHCRHAHQSLPLFHALGPLIYACIASPSSFNHHHRSPLIAGKFLTSAATSCPCEVHPIPLSILEPSCRAPVAGAARSWPWSMVDRPE
jgi:hypothetical protein